MHPNVRRDLPLHRQLDRVQRAVRVAALHDAISSARLSKLSTERGVLARRERGH